MKDQIDLSHAQIEQSPADIASWPITVGITEVDCRPQEGFAFQFDRVIPDSWKWPSNPAVQSDNFQWTAWAFIKAGDLWIGAGFVQMWQGRPMLQRALPPIFADDEGVPGYVNWWGDVRRLWPSMAGYIPKPGDQIGLMISAGNARLRGDVTSVRERSNVVLVTLVANDTMQQVFSGDPTPVPVPIPPTPIPPPPPGVPGPAGPEGPAGPKGDKGDPGSAGDLGDVRARLDALEKRKVPTGVSVTPIKIFGYSIKISASLTYE